MDNITMGVCFMALRVSVYSVAFLAVLQIRKWGIWMKKKTIRNILLFLFVPLALIAMIYVIVSL